MNLSKLSPAQKAVFAELIRARGKEFNCFPLAPEQKRLWFFDQLIPNSPLFNLPTALWIDGEVEPDALARAFSGVIERHALLRCGFINVEGEPYLALMPKSKCELEYVDARKSSEAAPDTRALQLAEDEGKAPFDLERGLLVRMKLIQTAQSRYLLVINMHHIVSDAWSISILIRELFELYHAFRTGGPALLPPLPLQYTDYAVWRNQLLEASAFEEQVQYWRKRLCSNHTPTLLPSIRRAAKPTYAGDTIAFALDDHLSGQLRSLCRELGITVQAALLTAFKLLLSRYANSRNITVGSPVSSRVRTELESLIGFFINTLVLRTEFAPEMTVREALLAVSTTLLEAQANRDVPFDSLVEQLRPYQPEELRSQPYFHIMFAAQPPMNHQVLEFDGLRIQNAHVNSGTAKTDLAMFIGELDDGIAGTVEFNTDLFDHNEIRQFIAHFQNTVEAIVRAPVAPISNLNFLGPPEQASLLRLGNVGCATPNVVLPLARFCDMVALHPEHTAVICGRDRLTYSALHRRAREIAAHLRRKGVKRGDVAALLADRDIDMVPSILGILFSGAAYVPLDPAYPDDRLSRIVGNCRPDVLIANGAHHHKACQFHPGLVLSVSDSDAQPLHPDAAIDFSIHKDQAAYLIYTSGSTGTPKGVTLTHHGLALLVDAQINGFMLNPDSRVLQFASLGFDASVSEIFCTLLASGTLVVPNRSELLDPSLLKRVISEHGITHATLSPSLLAALPSDTLEGLRVLICAGEALPLAVAKHWASRLPVLNAYGPTEVTVCATMGAVSPEAGTVKIGRPLAHIEAYVLDDSMRLVPVGMEGTLFIGGASIAHGYCGQPDLTAEKFVPNPFATDFSGLRGTRLYNTGDRVRWCADGQLEFLGRIDDQVKLRGYRIELREVEQALRDQPNVSDAAVLIDGDGQDRHLVAYVAGTADTVALKSALQNRLPSFMLPRHYMVMEAFPTSLHGKLDKRLLPRPDVDDKTALPDEDRPSSETEVAVARVWQQVLDRRNIGKAENFFACGGNSLLAIKLCVKLSQVLDRDVPVSFLFENPTIESLAMRIRQGGPDTAIMPVCVEGRERKLVFVPAMGGNLCTYHALANQIKERYDCFELNAGGLSPEIQSDIRLAAAHYANVLASFGQPITLCGWSFGGIMAIELANRLTESGVTVEKLILLDPSVFAVGKHSVFGTHAIKHLAQNLADAFDIADEAKLNEFVSRCEREHTALTHHRLNACSVEHVVLFFSAEFGDQLASQPENPTSSLFDSEPLVMRLPEATHYSMLKASAAEVIGRCIRSDGI